MTAVVFLGQTTQLFPSTQFCFARSNFCILTNGSGNYTYYSAGFKSCANVELIADNREDTLISVDMKRNPIQVCQEWSFALLSGIDATGIKSWTNRL